MILTLILCEIATVAVLIIGGISVSKFEDEQMPN